MTLTIGSLFSGIGGLERGLEMAGLGPVVWQVELDPFCRGVLARHWPEAVRHVDIRTVAGIASGGSLSPVDVLCGGFPCQDISNAGKRAGIDGDRSGLWREYARVVEELRPRFVVVENVAALLARGVDRVVGDLGRLGYRVEGRLVQARDVGAPHKRERLFLVAYRDGVGFGGERGASGEGAHGDVADGRDRAQLADASCAGLEGRSVEPAREECATPERGRFELAVASGIGRDEGQWREPETRGRAVACVGCEGVADAERERGRVQPGWRAREGGPDPLHAGRARGEGGAPVEPGLGRDADGVPGRVDRWPAGRGEAQHDWEPPRTLSKARRVFRRDRLKALGNAVVSQCGELAGRRVMEVSLSLSLSGAVPE